MFLRAQRALECGGLTPLSFPREAKLAHDLSGSCGVIFRDKRPELLENHSRLVRERAAEALLPLRRVRPAFNALPQLLPISFRHFARGTIQPGLQFVLKPQ